MPGMISCCTFAGMVVAQSGAGEQALGRALVWAGVLGGAVVVLGVVMMVLRARTLGKQRDAVGGVFDDLRRMRDRGEITSEEFEQTRRVVAERMRGNRAERARVASISAAEAREILSDADGDEVRAKPGYDLTGMPLPSSGSGRGPGGTGREADGTGGGAPGTRPPGTSA